MMSTLNIDISYTSAVVDTLRGCCDEFGVTIERIRTVLTKTLQVPPEPKEAHDNYHNVDEAQVCQDRNEVNVELLVRLEILDVDTVQHVRNRHEEEYVTHVFKPDSVDALAPKNQASIAGMFP